MRMKLTALAGVLLLVAACETTPEDDSASTGTGGATSSSSGTKAAPIMEETMPPKMTGQEALIQEVGDRVFFDYDRASIRPDAAATLRRQAEFLTQRPGLQMTITGHCDERGTREYNLALGERRAIAAKNFLISLGINPTRLSTISYGKERPIVIGPNEWAWAQNRAAVSSVN